MGATPGRAAAALAALVLATAASGADGVTQEEVEAAIERGVEHLRATYARGDGRGDGRAFGQPSILHHPGLHALALYALLRAGVPRDDTAVRRLLARLALDPTETTYDAAGLVLALCALDPLEHRTWLAELRAKLVGWQEPAGDWGYPGGGDLSNTQFAALALHALADAGFELEPALWERLARAVLRYRGRHGGFVYAVGSREETGSMTTAGVGTLALCELELARHEALDPELEAALRDARRGGLAWIDARFEVDRNPEGPAWTHYWLYGVERVGALCGVERLGGRDWYRAGARFLVDTQRGDGAWAGTFERIPTVFALLFLRRATRPPVPVTGRARPGPAARGAPVELVLGAGAPLRMAVELPAEVRAQVARVEYLADGAVVAVALADPDRPPGDDDLACRRWFPVPGARRFEARVSLRGPDGAERALRSNAIERDVGPGVPAWMLALEAGPALARVPTERARAKASSTLDGGDGLPAQGCAARFALDGNPRSPWIAEAEDGAPALSIRLKRRQPVDRVRVHLARLVGDASVGLGRAAAVELRVDRGSWRRREVVGDPRRPLEWLLSPGTRPAALELRLVPGAPPRAPLGIGEVELWRAAD